MNKYESWTIKKAEHKELMLLKCGTGEDSWESLGRRSTQLILKEINPDYSLEGLMLKLQYLGHLMQRADSLENTMMLGKEEKGVAEYKIVGWHHWLNEREFEQTPGNNVGQGSLACYSPDWDTTEQPNKSNNINSPVLHLFISLFPNPWQPWIHLSSL